MEENVNIFNIPIEKIKPYGRNPRKNDQAVDAVAASIKEFGFRVPLLVDKNNVIVAGHTRYKAAVKLGMTELPCIIADDLTPTQVKAYRLMDNKAQEKSRWDETLLQQEFQELWDMGFDLTKTGFSNYEIPEFDIDESDKETTSADTYEAYEENGETLEESEHGQNYEPEYDDELNNDYDTEYAETEYRSENVSEAKPAMEYVCIVCCDGEEEKRTIAEIIGEKGELKRRYTVSGIVRMLEDGHETY